MIERASYGVDLYPGDLIGSGTCSTGCLLELNLSSSKEKWLEDGDEINLEVECLKIIHKHVYEKAIVKVNFIVKAKEEAPKIRGNKIPGIKNIIAVASGKGGVGKSTITSNLAIGLVSKGYKVGLLDADIYGPSIHIMFDVENEKPKGTNDKGEKKILPIESFGVKLLSIGFFSETQKAVVWRGPMASKALNQMLWNH